MTLAAYTGPTTIRQCGVVIESRIVTGDIVAQTERVMKYEDMKRALAEVSDGLPGEKAR